MIYWCVKTVEGGADMPICQKCNETWSWGETLRTTWTLDTCFHCPKCGKKQYPTMEAKKRFSKYVLIPPLSILLTLLDIPGIFVLGTLFVSGLVILCIYPFTLQLTNEEQLPW